MSPVPPVMSRPGASPGGLSPQRTPHRHAGPQRGPPQRSGPPRQARARRQAGSQDATPPRRASCGSSPASAAGSARRDSSSSSRSTSTKRPGCSTAPRAPAPTPARRPDRAQPPRTHRDGSLGHQHEPRIGIDVLRKPRLHQSQCTLSDIVRGADDAVLIEQVAIHEHHLVLRGRLHVIRQGLGDRHPFQAIQRLRRTAGSDGELLCGDRSHGQGAHRGDRSAILVGHRDGHPLAPAARRRRKAYAQRTSAAGLQAEVAPGERQSHPLRALPGPLLGLVIEQPMMACSAASSSAGCTPNSPACCRCSSAGSPRRTPPPLAATRPAAPGRRGRSQSPALGQPVIQMLDVHLLRARRRPRPATASRLPADPRCSAGVSAGGEQRQRAWRASPRLFAAAMLGPRRRSAQGGRGCSRSARPRPHRARPARAAPARRPSCSGSTSGASSVSSSTGRTRPRRRRAAPAPRTPCPAAAPRPSRRGRRARDGWAATGGR